MGPFGYRRGPVGSFWVRVDFRLRNARRNEAVGGVQPGKAGEEKTCAEAHPTRFVAHVGPPYILGALRAGDAFRASEMEKLRFRVGNWGKNFIFRVWRAARFCARRGFSVSLGR